MDCSNIKYDYSENRDFLFGLFSDVHIDSEGHNKELFIKHIESIINRNGRVFFNGDMGNFITKNDRKRYSRSRDKYNVDSQLDKQIELIVNELKPYADYIDYMGIGNHEVSVIKFNSTNPLYRISDKLMQYRSKTLPRIFLGDYQGFMNICFNYGDKRALVRYVIYRHHGKGGQAPITKGLIDFSRINKNFIADCYWVGHKHNQFIDDSEEKLGINSVGDLVKTIPINIMTAGYEKGVNVKNREESFEEYNIDDDDYKINYSEEEFYGGTTNGCVELNLKVLTNSIDNNKKFIAEAKSIRG